MAFKVKDLVISAQDCHGQSIMQCGPDNPSPKCADCTLTDNWKKFFDQIDPALREQLVAEVQKFKAHTPTPTREEATALEPKLEGALAEVRRIKNS